MRTLRTRLARTLGAALRSSLLPLVLGACGGAAGGLPSLEGVGVLDDEASARAANRAHLDASLEHWVDADVDDALAALAALETPTRDEEAARLLLLVHFCVEEPTACGAVDHVRAALPPPSTDPLLRVLRLLVDEDLGSRVDAPWEGAILDRPELGRPPAWRVAGPFDEVEEGQPLEPEAAEFLADRTTLPGGRVDARWEPVDAGLFAMGAEGAGVFFAETFVEVDEPGTWLVAAHAWEPYTLTVEGRPMLVRTVEDGWKGTLQFRTIDVEPGTHRVLLRREVDGSERRAWVALLPLGAGPSPRFVQPDAGARPGAAPARPPVARSAPLRLEDAFAAWATASDSTSRSLAAVAASYAGASDAVVDLLDTEEGEPANAVDAWRQALLLHSAGAIPPNERRSARADLARRSVERWPGAHRLRLALASEWVRTGQREAALEVLRSAVEDRPEHAATVALYATTVEELGWRELAEPYREILAHLDPPDCRSVGVVLQRQGVRSGGGESVEVPEPWLRCANAWEVWMTARFRAGEDREVLLEEALTRLRGSATERVAPWMLALRLASAMDPTGERAAALLDDPRAPWIGDIERATLRADLLDADDAAAADALAREMAHRPASLERRLYQGLLTGERVLDDLRIDGADEVRRWVESGIERPGGAVYVLDYGATRYFEDGSGVDLVHQIVRLQTRDVLGSYGEVGVPDDAFLLTVRTLKPDGRALVPMDIAGKDAISMPSLELGDFIELEYVRPIAPGAIRRPVARGGRFYFRIPDALLYRSLAVYEFPVAWDEEAVVDVRHLDGEVRVSEVEGRVRYEVEARDVAPAPEVFQAPPASEWLPSVRFGHGVDAALRARLYHRLVERQTQPDTRTRRWLAELWETLPAGATEVERVRAVFRAINARPDFSGFFSMPGAHFFTELQGERQTALFAALRAGGWTPELVAIRTIDSDQSVEAIFDETEYDLTAVRVRAGTETVWMEPDFDHYPFNYLRSEAQGRPAVVLSGPRRGERFVAPTWPTALDASRVSLDVVVEEDGVARLVCEERMSLRASANWRSFLEMTDDERVIREQFERALSQSFGPITFQRFTFEGLEDADAPLTLHYTFEAPHLARRMESGAIVLEGEFFEKSLDRAFGRESERMAPLVVPIPIRDELTVTIRVVGRSPASAVPGDIESTWGEASFARHHRVEDGGLRMTRTIDLPAGRIPREAYPGFRSFVRETARDGRLRVVFE